MKQVSKYSKAIDTLCTGLDTVVLFQTTGGGARMFLCEDGTLSSNLADAMEMWRMQVDATLAEHPILRQPEILVISKTWEGK